MGTSGWLQLAVLGLALLVAARRARRLHRAGLRRRGASRGRRLRAARARDLSPHGRQPGERAALDGLRPLRARVQHRLDPRAVPPAARAGSALPQSHRRDRRPAGTRLQHGRQLRHQHELAELRRRVDDEPPHADERARRPELRLRGGRHGGGDRSRPRHHAAAQRDDRQLLGRRHPLGDADPASALDRARTRARRARRDPEPRRLHRGPNARRARRSRSPGARSRARRRSRSSGRTAAARSTRTRRTRSRTRRRSRTCSRSSRSS